MPPPVTKSQSKHLLYICNPCHSPSLSSVLLVQTSSQQEQKINSIDVAQSQACKLASTSSPTAPGRISRPGAVSRTFISHSISGGLRAVVLQEQARTGIRRLVRCLTSSLFSTISLINPLPVHMLGQKAMHTGAHAIQIVRPQQIPDKFTDLFNRCSTNAHGV